MIGKGLFSKSSEWLQQVMGTKNAFGDLLAIALGYFYQMLPVKYL